MTDIFPLNQLVVVVAFADPRCAVHQGGGRQGRAIHFGSPDRGTPEFF